MDVFLASVVGLIGVIHFRLFFLRKSTNLVKSRFPSPRDVCVDTFAEVYYLVLPQREFSCCVGTLRAVVAFLERREVQ